MKDIQDNLVLFLENPIIYLLGLFLVACYFFFKKKFENLADKDDISDLTREVENVKKEFNEDLEKLKSNLAIIKSHQVNLVNEKRKTIYDFWGSINVLFEKSTSLYSYNINDFETYKIFEVDINKSRENFNLMRSSFELIVHNYIDDELYGLISDFSKLNLKQCELSNETGLKIVDFYFNKNNIEEYTNITEKYKQQYESLIDETYLNHDSIKVQFIYHYKKDKNLIN
ncbi:hypothetical protein [Tenacibaculum piscium]|uniref:hypothetical protein n=1 Tax=Tenacibaculum piscium TaxID=1458515 RepID=UPI001F27105B|nr:hypothetical protein [Tenacibaculum piscium]